MTRRAEDLPLPKPFKGAILASKPRASGECRLEHPVSPSPTEPNGRMTTLSWHVDQIYIDLGMR
jgi:hypothetical protein